MGLISFIVPFSSRVDELELRIEQLVSLAAEVKQHDFEFIYLANGSNRASNKRLEDRIEKDNRHRVVILTRDFCASTKFIAGMTYASGDCAIYIGEAPLARSEILIEMIRYWESGSKFIISRKENSTQRNSGTLSAVRNKISSLLTGYPNQITIGEICCLLIDKHVMYVLTQITEPHRDILENLAWTGFQARLVESSYQEGEGKGVRSAFQDEILVLSTELRIPTAFRTSKSIGILVAFLGGLFSIGFIYALAGYENIIPDWWLIISSMLVVIGIQMYLIGMVGGKLHRSIDMMSDKPLFVVDTIINPPVQSTPEGKEKLEKMILSLWSMRKRRNDFLSNSGSPISPTSEE